MHHQEASLKLDNLFQELLHLAMERLKGLRNSKARFYDVHLLLKVVKSCDELHPPELEMFLLEREHRMPLVQQDRAEDQAVAGEGQVKAHRTDRTQTDGGDALDPRKTIQARQNSNNKPQSTFRSTSIHRQIQLSLCHTILSN